MELRSRRAALVLAAFLALLYLPMAGNHGLWDPWETHYGEVARQMASRGDWISLWWPGSPIDPSEFFSKPVLTFWLQAFALRLFGLAGAAASPSEMVDSWRAEWALRMPGIVLGIATLLGIWHLVRRLAGERAALLMALILATSVQWALVTRQAMTDLPFVAPMTLALVLGALALLLPEEEREAELPRRKLGPLSYPAASAFYLFIALFAVVTLAQLVTFSIQLRPRLGAHAIPGVVPMLPYFASFIVSTLWTSRARNRRQLYLLSAYVLCGLASLAKGPAGLALPGIVLVMFLLTARRWRDLLRLEIPRGALVFLTVAFPWYHAMLIRHGARFWNEFIGDNHFNRAKGRHGDRGSFDYYLQWAGCGMFPWSGIAALGAIAACRRTTRKEPRMELARFALIWLAVDYAVLTAVTTKFHHYILPALPALAILGGLLLDEIIERPTRAHAAGLVLVAAPLTLLFGRDLAVFPARLLWLFTYDYVAAPGTGRTWPAAAEYKGRFEYETTLWVLAIVATALCVILALRARRASPPDSQPSPAPVAPRWPIIPALVAVVAGIAAGPATPAGAPPHIPQYLWLLPLALVLLSLPWLRYASPERIGVTRWLFVALACANTLFVLDRVMLDLSPHWSQKHVIATYYRERKGPDEPLVVWDLYWRGENFYTANEIYSAQSPAERTAFNSRADGSARLGTWLSAHAGRRVFFLVDRGRLQQVKGMLPEGSRESFLVVDESCNKLYLAVATLGR